MYYSVNFGKEGGKMSENAENKKLMKKMQRQMIIIADNVLQCSTDTSIKAKGKYKLRALKACKKFKKLKAKWVQNKC